MTFKDFQVFSHILHNLDFWLGTFYRTTFKKEDLKENRTAPAAQKIVVSP